MKQDVNKYVDDCYKKNEYLEAYMYALMAKECSLEKSLRAFCPL